MNPQPFSEHAACRDADPAVFFPLPRRDGELADEDLAAAREWCNRCPVFTECHAWALDHEAEGIWAGTSPAMRNRLRRTTGRRLQSVDTAIFDVVPSSLEDGDRSAREIAEALDISQRTVVRHRTKNRQEAS